ncbi:nicotinate-nucleotide--dimethylbenzimidazole phosphoribosyltransferase [Salmonella enterica subsp. enterica]|nr:nicotinate-nucleotide--dimethylbenzimidazole phosphoribosyltransferase [Salmonella enterica subsp. enterica]
MANTTPAAARPLLQEVMQKEVVGIGANLPPSRIDNKVDVVRRRLRLISPIRAMAFFDVRFRRSVGGFDLVTG